MWINTLRKVEKEKTMSKSAWIKYSFFSVFLVQVFLKSSVKCARTGFLRTLTLKSEKNITLY